MKALALVTYLPDPNFNTRTGIEETIVLQVSPPAKYCARLG